MLQIFEYTSGSPPTKKIVVQTPNKYMAGYGMPSTFEVGYFYKMPYIALYSPFTGRKTTILTIPELEAILDYLKKKPKPVFKKKKVRKKEKV